MTSLSNYFVLILYFVYFFSRRGAEAQSFDFLIFVIFFNLRAFVCPSPLRPLRLCEKNFSPVPLCENTTYYRTVRKTSLESAEEVLFRFLVVKGFFRLVDRKCFLVDQIVEPRLILFAAPDLLLQFRIVFDFERSVLNNFQTR